MPETATYIEQEEFTINEIIGNIPGKFLYSGITMIAIVTATILIMSHFIHYPDKIVSTGTLTSDSPPIEVVSRTNGFIEEIVVENGTYVEEGETLLYIHNTTNKEELDQLQQWVVRYERITDPRKYLHLSFPKQLQLGSIQGEYSNLQLQYNELIRTLKDGVVFERMKNIDREISKIILLNNSERDVKGIYKEELALSKKDNDRQKTLLGDGIISEMDLEKSHTALLQMERQYESMENGIIQNNIRIEQLELEKLKLKEERANLIKNYQFSIAGILANVRSGTQNWTDTYSLQAPLSGTIAYMVNAKLKKSVQNGQPLLYISPDGSSENYISAIYPSLNIGKLSKGQKAIIKFDAFPYKEYGMVISEVASISLLPEIDEEGKSNYEIVIPLSATIITDYNKQIDIKPKMTATIEIITEDRSILQRIFDQFLSLINTST